MYPSLGQSPLKPSTIYLLDSTNVPFRLSHAHHAHVLRYSPTLSFPGHSCWVSVHSQQHFFVRGEYVLFTDLHNQVYHAKAKEDQKPLPCRIGRHQRTSKPAIAANLSRAYNRLSSKERPHHNQKVACPTSTSPLAFQTQNCLP